MKIESLLFVGALALVCGTAAAQTGAAAPPLAASGPRAGTSPPRLLTPPELRDIAGSPDNERPEGAVTPQLRVPLSRKAPVPLQPASRAAPGIVDDAVARCEAQVSELARAECRATLARTGRTP